MPKVQIDIEAKSTGDADLQRRIEQLRETGRVTNQVSEFELKLAEAYDKSGGSLKEQSRLLREHEKEQRRLISGARKDWRIERQELKAQRTAYNFEQIDREILEQEKRFRLWEREVEGYEESRREWEERKRPEMQDGRQDGRAGEVDMATMLTNAGITQGGVGLAQAGVSGIARAGMKRMAGMSTAGKIGAGLGIGLGVGVLAKAIQWMVGGIELSKQFNKQLLPIRASLQQMGKDSEPLNEQIKELSQNLGESLSVTIEMAREWARLGGMTRFGEDTGAEMDRTVMAGKIWGIDPQQTIAFTGQMARFSTYFNEEEGMTDRTIRDAVLAANTAGMGGLRREEFIQQVLTTTQAAAGTAGVVSPQDMINFSLQIASLGEPFRDERGGAFAARIHAGLTRDGESGIGFLATRRMLGEDATLFQIKSQQLKGIADPENLRGRWEFIKGMSGGDLDKAAMAFAQELGMPEQLRMIYNPESVSGDKLKDSLIEYFEAGEEMTVEGLKMTPEKIQSEYNKITARKPEIGMARLAREMARELGYDTPEMLYTTREGFDKTPLGEIMAGRKPDQEFQEFVTQYQGEVAEAIYKEDYGFKTQYNEAVKAVIQMHAGKGVFEIITTSLTNIYEGIQKMVDYFTGVEADISVQGEGDVFVPGKEDVFIPGARTIKTKKGVTIIFGADPRYPEGT